MSPPLETPEYIWEHLSGRLEGELYSVYRLVDGSGRVIAKVHDPDQHSYDHRAYFHLEKEMDEGDFRFCDVDSAKRFVLEKLAERAAKLRAAAAETAGSEKKEGVLTK